MSDINMGNTGTILRDDTIDISGISPQDLVTITSTGIAPLSFGAAGAVGSNGLYVSNGGVASTISTISIGRTAQEYLEDYEMNLLTVSHAMQEQEILQLKDSAPDYTDHIKENLAKMAAREVVKRMTFTKKVVPDTYTHQFNGRIYVFTKEELIQLIKDIQNA